MQLFKEVWGLIERDANAIQAIVALLGLIVLSKYALDTRTIARATAHQSQATLLPFLAIVVETRNNQQEWYIKNAGSGPAKNIRYTPIDPTELVGQKSPMMSGETRRLCSAEEPDRSRLGEELRKREGFVIGYESLSGERLTSSFKQSFHTGEIEVGFKREQI
jgi:hypothetical protein